MNTKTYRIEAETERGHKITFSMQGVNENAVRAAAESRLQSYGIPKKMAAVVKVS